MPNQYFRPSFCFNPDYRASLHIQTQCQHSKLIAQCRASKVTTQTTHKVVSVASKLRSGQVGVLHSWLIQKETSPTACIGMQDPKKLLALFQSTCWQRMANQPLRGGLAADPSLTSCGEQQSRR